MKACEKGCTKKEILSEKKADCKQGVILCKIPVKILYVKVAMAVYL